MADSKLDFEAQGKLFRLLRDAEDGKPDALREHLDTAPVEATNDLLFSIATRATPTYYNTFFWVYLFALLFWLAIVIRDLLLGKGLWQSLKPLSSQFMVHFYFLGVLYKWTYRKGRAALVHLAECNDLRAMPLLLAEWQAHPLPTRDGWNDRVAEALARLLDEAAQDTPLTDTQDKLQKIAGQLMPSPRFWHRFRGLYGDLSPASAYLAVAVLRRLQLAGGTDNRDILARIAGMDVSPGMPRRIFVRDAACSLLPAVPVPVSAVPSAAEPLVARSATSASSVVQTLHRS